MWLDRYTSGVMALITWFEVIVAGFALIDASLRRPAAFIAADKQKKAFWMIILGLSFVMALLLPGLGFINLLAIVAGLVYLVDARPALRAVGKNPRGGGNGPYGSW